jgi:chromosome segregation ATPase
MNSQMSKTVLAWAAVSSALLLALVWQRVALKRDVRELESDKAALTAQITKLKAQPPPAPVQVEKAPESPAPCEKAATEDDARVRELALKDESITKLQNELAVTRARVGELENTVLNLQNQSAATDQHAREQLATAETNCTQRVSRIQQSLDTLQASLNAEKSRTAELQAANTSLHSQLSTSKRAAADADLIAGWRDLNHRRESYLRAITRRYRDISAQYRSFSGALSGRQEQQTGPWNSPELSRIQSEITSVDDDLRQLDQLNDRAALMEKELAKR